MARSARDIPGSRIDVPANGHSVQGPVLFAVGLSAVAPMLAVGPARLSGTIGRYRLVKRCVNEIRR